MDSARATWQPDLTQRTGPRYAAIVDVLAADIAAGRLRPGDWLPTHRHLAASLGVDLTTVTRAYGEARRRGLVEAIVGRGTFVRGAATAAPASPPPAVDLTMNLPPAPLGLSLAEQIARGLATVQRRADFAGLMTYGPSAGRAEDRAAGAHWLRPRLAIEPDRLLVCAGAQAALALVLGTLVERGQRIVAEWVTYPGFKALAQYLGLELVAAPLDGEGLVPDALEEVCRRTRPKALYVVPTIHNPTTATMSPARRAAIAAIARRHDLLVIEDDAYGFLPSDSPAALASHAPERSLYIAGLAKCVAPGLRLAYLAAPTPALAARLAAGMRATTLMTAPLIAALATQWIADGSIASIIAAVRAESAARQRLAAKLLPAGSIAAHPEGHHLWLALPPGFGRSEFAALLRSQGLAVVASDAFAIGAAPDALRVSLGVGDRAALAAALARLAEAIARGPAQLGEVV